MDRSEIIEHINYILKNTTKIKEELNRLDNSALKILKELEKL